MIQNGCVLAVDPFSINQIGKTGSFCLLWQSKEDRVYFWRKAGKALNKKVPENRKKYRKFGRKPENTILRKAGKAYFICGKPETDPLFLASVKD